MTFTPILCIDFDGVIHDYKEGWKGGVIYGNLTPGFLAWALEARNSFKLVVYSSRSKTPEGIEAMQGWLRSQLAERLMPNEIDDLISSLEFANVKPPAWLTIDDRAIQFRGDWSELSPAFLLAFKPWMSK